MKQNKMDFISSILSGLIISFLFVIIVVTFTQLIFHGRLAAYFPLATYLILFTTLLTGLILALFSSLPISIGNPQDESLPVVVITTSSIATAVQNPENLLSTLLIVIAFSTFFTGISFYLAGKFKWGNIIRFIPFSVIAGFLVSVGCLLILSTFHNVMSILPQAHFTDLNAFFHSSSFIIWSVIIAYTGLFFLVMHHFRHRLVLPAFLLFSIFMFYVLIFIFHIPMQTLREQGLLFENFPKHGALLNTISELSFYKVEWHAIYPQLGNLLTIMPISLISCLLILGALEVNLKKEIDFNKELRVNGAINILISLGCGLVSYTNLVLTIINSDLKSTSRLPGILAAVFTFLILIAGMNLIAFIPKIIPFGLLFFIGFSILKTWTYDIRHAFYALDYFCVFMILSTVLFLGLLAGVFVGILVSIISITLHYSRISPIKYRVEGKNLSSGNKRDKVAENILEKAADSLLLIKLQNYLFFGIVCHLVDFLKNTLASQSDKLQYIIYDFENVPGMDASGLHCFLQIKFLAKSHKTTLVITEINKQLHEKLIKIGFLEPDNSSIVVIPQYQQAIEWCEEQVLANNNYKKDKLPLESQFNNMINNDFYSKSIRKYFNKLKFKKKDILTKQGDFAANLYYLESGELSVFRTDKNHKKIFISTIHPGNIIGEMGLYSGIRRTATIVAKKDAVVEELTKENFEKMCAEEPKLAEKFHRIIISILIYRLK